MYLKIWLVLVIALFTSSQKMACRVRSARPKATHEHKQLPHSVSIAAQIAKLLRSLDEVGPALANG